MQIARAKGRYDRRGFRKARLRRLILRRRGAVNTFFQPRGNDQLRRAIRRANCYATSGRLIVVSYRARKRDFDYVKRHVRGHTA